MKLRKLYSILDVGAIKSKAALKKLSGIEHIRAVLAFRILAVLKKHYERYAFSEVIRTDNGQTTIIYDYRDAEFEAEVKRHGMEVEIRPAMHPRRDLYMSPYTNMKRKPFFREFEMTSHLMLREGKKEPTEAKRSPNVKMNDSEGRRKVIINETTHKENIPQARIVIHIEGAEVDNSF
jgi:hypothetical protein